jgi:2,5-diketo-D-gluconate reductase A
MKLSDSTYVSLGGNGDLPLVGFGTYLIPDQEASLRVREAIETGYRHIDTAEIYRNERGVGAGIAEGLRQTGRQREHLFVTTKLWPGRAGKGQTPKNLNTTIQSLKDSLERLQLDYVDLYLIHAPMTPDFRIEQWQGLVELQAQGYARAIGVSNYGSHHIEELHDAGLPSPAANQIELHPWTQKPTLVKELLSQRIVPIAYSSLAPLDTWRAAPGEGSGKTQAMRDEACQADWPLRLIAKKHDKSEAQILLRWGLEKGYPILPKSRHPQRIRQNFDLFSFALDAKDMAHLDAMDRGDGLAWSIGDPVHMK